MGTLHVVATPIGNLEDITLRALRLLGEADLLFAEDTRRTRILLDHHGIAARPVSLNAHNEAGRIERALAALAEGRHVALVSDAGTPLVSDPGARLVAAAAEAGHDVEAAPGPSAVLTALTVSGLRAHPFAFAGFLPRKTGARRRLLESHRGRRETLVLFESPHRVAETLQDLAAVFGAERRACVARELTKLHEEVVRAPLAELAERFAEGARGEITIVVEGVSGDAEAEVSPPSPEIDVDVAIGRLVAEGRRPREIAARLARDTGVPRRELYARAVEAQRALAAEAGDADADGGRRVLSGLVRMSRVWRTVRPLRPRQIAAQARHAVFGIRPPRPWRGPTPGLRVRRVDVPFLPAPPHARLQPGLSLELINQRVALDSPIDWASEAEGPLFAYHLHQHDFLRGESIAPRIRAEWMLDWVRRHPHGAGWDPHPSCLRVLCWGKLLVTPAALSLSDEEEAEIRTSMARQLEALARNVEVRLQANHLLSNRIGLCFGGVLFDGPHADGWLAQGAALLEDLADQVGDDGLHAERSPMYHALLLENVLDLIGLAQAAPDRLSDELLRALRDSAARMLGALDVVTHPDGGIALFADSAFGIAHPPDVLRRYASARGIAGVSLTPPGVLEDGRYVRLSGRPFTLIASVGGPAPAWQPGHAHCDALGFELSCGDHRVVTDTGVYEYVPGERRDRARATLAHATIEVGGAEQAEIWAAHRIGGRPCVQLEEVLPGRQLTASCASWSTPDSLHRRTWTLRDGDLEIHDVLEGPRRPIRLALPLAPGLEPRLAHDVDGGTEAHVPLPGGRRLVVALPISARWRIEHAPYYPEFGRSEDRACLLGESEDFEDGTWWFRLPA